MIRFHVWPEAWVMSGNAGRRSGTGMGGRLVTFGFGCLMV